MYEFVAAKSGAKRLHLISQAACAAWVEGLTQREQKWVKSQNFTGRSGQVITFPSAKGGVDFAAIGLGDDAAQARHRFVVGGARRLLPVEDFEIVGDWPVEFQEECALGWLLAGYEFTRYAGKARPLAGLVAPPAIDADEIGLIASSEAMVRDLINTPTNDMGPEELEAAAVALASEFDAKTTVIRGEELLSDNFPLIHAVGRASVSAPRLIDFAWGESGPLVTLVGKGVCFDTGGLNLKSGASMGLMKKDMGGAANVLGLARMIMGAGLPIRLRVLIPAVENAVAGSSFRPGDILIARNGKSVEINNTDAEGRLVLADALTLAGESAPDLVISMATLTGAARVAVGADLAAYFSTSDADAQAVEKASEKVCDPIWRLPFWAPYEPMIEPGVADLDNAPKGGMAGAITAALFLKRFVPETTRYLHFDIYGWNPASAPARPKGGVGQGIRALFAALSDLS